MHLLTILAFAFVFWEAEQPGRWVWVAPDDTTWTLVVVLALPLTLCLAAGIATRRGLRLLHRHQQDPQLAQRFHHRSTLVFRVAIGIWFASVVFLTRWPDWFTFDQIAPPLRIVGDLAVLLPFTVNILMLWIISFPLEREFYSFGTDRSAENDTGSRWRMGAYLDFHIRHYFLVIAAPMLLILFCTNITRGYAEQLQGLTGWIWTPEAILGVVAFGVFVSAPAILRRIWRTGPLEQGEIRSRLEETCRRIDLQYRDILVWNSGGIMINAAVMGVIAPLRFVLLSDALLATMTIKQIEAVFGHEVGHVKHRHIQHFLLFAFVGWLLVAGSMELAAWFLGHSKLSLSGSLPVIEATGVLSAILLWGIGFGWLSRRFERQADLFGAHCVTPAAEECLLPCSVHPDSPSTEAEEARGGVCATGAAVFASALDRVALLNGIPHEERSWRHSSIGSRIRFLAALAGDPYRVRRFERTLRRVRILLVACAFVGLAATIYYWIVVPEPAILGLRTGLP